MSGTENLPESCSGFPSGWPRSRLILIQELIDPGPVMGDLGEGGGGICIGLFIGDNALGHPSTQKRAPRVSLWDREGKGEREGELGNHPLFPVAPTLSWSDLPSGSGTLAPHEVICL